MGFWVVCWFGLVLVCLICWLVRWDFFCFCFWLVGWLGVWLFWLELEFTSLSWAPNTLTGTEGSLLHTVILFSEQQGTHHWHIV